MQLASLNMALRPRPSVSSVQFASELSEKGARKAEAEALGVKPPLVSRWAAHLVKPTTANRIRINARRPSVSVEGWDIDAESEVAA